MIKVNIFDDIEGTEFPQGRRTRVIIGENGAIKNTDFAQGYVVIYPKGYVALHDHENVESYTILEGTGEMTVDDETVPVKKGDVVFIESGQKHMLKNTSDKENMAMMFVYSPGNIVDHWEQEMDGRL
jgi:quercetin dioxygenase-like cupin family protein